MTHCRIANFLQRAACGRISHNHAAIRNLCSHGLVLKAGKALPKEDVRSALDHYSAEREMTVESSWTRPANLKGGPVYFESIEVLIDGEQPRHRLLCSIAARWEHDTRPALIGISILDRTSTGIMQTGPRPDPFIGGTAGVYQIDLAVELPPMIPGLYGVGFWMGPSPTESYDYVRLDLAIEIVDNPGAGRTAPYIPEAGYIVPPSTASVRKITGLAPFECVAK